MNAYKVMIASLVFFGLFTGASNFQQDFYEEQGVENNETLPIEKEYQELQGNVDELRSNVNAVQSPDEGLLDSAVAGLYLVPNFLGLILSPITILNAAIDSIAYQYIFVPMFLATLVKTVIIAGVSWSAFRLLIGLRG